jgi:hypothetical protein
LCFVVLIKNGASLDTLRTTVARSSILKKLRHTLPRKQTRPAADKEIAPNVLPDAMTQPASTNSFSETFASPLAGYLSRAMKTEAD